LKQHHLLFQPITSGEQLKVGEIDLQCLWPSRIIHGQGSDPSNASLVMLARVGGYSYLLAGDVESPAQKAIVQQYHLTHVDVLKVAHHGSRNQDVEFAKALQPTIGFISVGAHNDYGHPAAETIALYESLGTHIFRTDINGGLAVIDTGLSQFHSSKPGSSKPGSTKLGSSKPGPHHVNHPLNPDNSATNDTNSRYLEVVTAR
jgi:competence protein ComEC